jgi:basic membrane protein A and related proteins
MRSVRLAAAALALAAVAAGCGSSNNNGSAAAAGSTGSSSSVKPGVVTDIGGLGDHGFNDLAKAGADEAKAKDGVEGRILVPQTPADYANDLTQLAQAGAAPIFGIGFTFADPIAQMAKQFPKSHFAIVDAVVDAPNVVSLVFREEEGSYLAGLVAGRMTQVRTDYTEPAKKVVGFIGGQQSPLIEKFGAGYEQGVKDACPSCQVLYQYVGTTTQAFSDPGTASEIARNMHAKGADVIYHAAGASGDGLFKVASAEKFFAIGVNVDQAKTNPQAPILTSVLKRVDTAVASTIHAEVTGSWKGGVQSFGLSNDGIALAPFGKFDSMVPAAVKQAVTTAEKKIVDGKLKVATKLSEVKGG